MCYIYIHVFTGFGTITLADNILHTRHDPSPSNSKTITRSKEIKGRMAHKNDEVLRRDSIIAPGRAEDNNGDDDAPKIGHMLAGLRAEFFPSLLVPEARDS